MQVISVHHFWWMVSASKSRPRIFALSSGTAPQFAWRLYFFYHYRPQPLFDHMSLDTLYTAGYSVAIEGTAYFNSAIPLFWIIINLFHLMAEFLILLLSVWGYTNQSFVIGASWNLQGAAKLGYRVMIQVVLDKRHNLGYCSFANMAVAFFYIWL